MNYSHVLADEVMDDARSYIVANEHYSSVGISAAMDNSSVVYSANEAHISAASSRDAARPTTKENSIYYYITSMKYSS